MRVRPEKVQNPITESATDCCCVRACLECVWRDADVGGLSSVRIFSMTRARVKLCEDIYMTCNLEQAMKFDVTERVNGLHIDEAWSILRQVLPS